MFAFFHILVCVVLAVDPENFQANKHYGFINEVFYKDYKTAIQYYLRCLDINSNDPFCHYGLSVCLENSDKPSQAQINFHRSKATKLDKLVTQHRDQLIQQMT